MQTVVDEVSTRLSHSSAELIVSLFSQVFKYAIANDLANKNYAQFVRIKLRMMTNTECLSLNLI